MSTIVKNGQKGQISNSIKSIQIICQNEALYLSFKEEWVSRSLGVIKGRKSWKRGLGPPINSSEARRWRDLGQPITTLGQPMTLSEARGSRIVGQPMNSSKARRLRDLGQPITTSEVRGLWDLGLTLERSERLKESLSTNHLERFHSQVFTLKPLASLEVIGEPGSL